MRTQSVGIKPMTTWLKATCFTTEQRQVCYTSEFNKFIFLAWMNCTHKSTSRLYDD